LERSYERSNRALAAVCNSAEESFNRAEIMHDRLRLNLAVSQGAEIFSWHGDDKFISHDIGKVVRGGPISSGSFVGFLENIFVDSGIVFLERGVSEEHGITVLRFDYRVSKENSRFRVEGSGGKSALVPFHGSFWANVATSELTRLKIVADKIPSGLDICSTQSEVRYQMAEISGVRTLIPQVFELRIDDDTHLHTVSRGEFAQCHEFKAQSRLSFDPPGAADRSSLQPPVERWLPAGLKIQVVLITPIDTKAAFTGDAVEGVLAAPILTRDGEMLAPAGARLKGIITQLTKVYVPQRYNSLRIEFNSVTFRGETYLMRTKHLPNDKEQKEIRSIDDGVATRMDEKLLQEGTIFLRTNRLRLDDRARGNWLTLAPGTAAAH
jgi:hypothetical protein